LITSLTVHVEVQKSAFKAETHAASRLHMQFWQPGFQRKACIKVFLCSKVTRYIGSWKE